MGVWNTYLLDLQGRPLKPKGQSCKSSRSMFGTPICSICNGVLRFPKGGLGNRADGCLVHPSTRLRRPTFGFPRAASQIEQVGVWYIHLLDLQWCPSGFKGRPSVSQRRPCKSSRWVYQTPTCLIFMAALGKPKDAVVNQVDGCTRHPLTRFAGPIFGFPNFRSLVSHVVAL